MSWSTRELADLAGTTVNTVRHYHRVGLLDQPDRGPNGYKHYEVRHLVCLLRIRRLVELGVPLAEVGDVGSVTDTSADALRAVDAELAAKIDRLQAARTHIAMILRDGAPADTPEGFESVGSRLSVADSSIIHIYRQFYDEDALADVRAMAEADTDAVGAEIDALPGDADEATRQRLADRLAPIIARNLVDYPWLNDPAGRVTRGVDAVQETFLEALVELYNPAQLDVLGRASLMAQSRERDRREEPAAGRDESSGGA